MKDTTHPMHINAHDFSFQRLTLTAKITKKFVLTLKIPRLLRGGGSAYTQTKRSVVTTLSSFCLALYIKQTPQIRDARIDHLSLCLDNLINYIWQVIKLLKYDTVLKPFYIALSDDLRFHALYGDTSVVTSNSIGGAIGAIPNKQLYGLPNNAMDWERVSPATPNSNSYA